MLVVYEVNLSITDASIEKDFLDWLHNHINDMIKIDGFLGAFLLKDSEKDSTYTCHYIVRDEESLDAYLQHHAPKMRQDGLNRFPGKFKTTRRVLDLVNDYRAEEE